MKPLLVLLLICMVPSAAQAEDCRALYGERMNKIFSNSLAEHKSYWDTCFPQWQRGKECNKKKPKPRDQRAKDTIEAAAVVLSAYGSSWVMDETMKQVRQRIAYVETREVLDVILRGSQAGELCSRNEILIGEPFVTYIEQAVKRAYYGPVRSDKH